MSNEKWIELQGIIQKKGTLTEMSKPIGVKVRCKDQYAICYFSDKKLTKKLAKKEKASGRDVTYNEKLNVMIERFPGKSAQEVAVIIGEEMKKAGGTLAKQ